eukprot:11475759-Ditylum_brightwellii.AAC.1
MGLKLILWIQKENKSSDAILQRTLDPIHEEGYYMVITNSNSLIKWLDPKTGKQDDNLWYILCASSSS